MVSDQTVLWCNFLTQLPICFTLTFVLEHDKFPMLLHLGLVEYAEVFAMAAGVNWFANWIQQVGKRTGAEPGASAAAFVCRSSAQSACAAGPDTCGLPRVL